MSHKICSKSLILIRQIIPPEVRDEEVRHKYTNNTTDGRDDERPSLSQMCLDGCKGLCPNSSARLSNGSRNTIAGSPNGRRIAFRRDEAQHVSRSKITRGLHKTIEDDKKRNNFGDLVIGTADDQPENDCLQLELIPLGHPDTQIVKLLG